MSVAAVPEYLGMDHSDRSPGQRFGSFFQYWTKGHWNKPDSKKVEAMKRVLRYPDFSQQVSALSERQRCLANSMNDDVVAVSAVSVSPFVTGIGLEHPTENGFAFLGPYGLPYLPASGVKGVLRHAASLLIDGEFGEDSKGWSKAAIDALFGWETTSDEAESRRGALVFWDVLIQPKGFELGIDIMTPHFSDYYSGKSTPHESEQPNPIPFLVVPPGADFNFYIQCNPERIEDSEIRLQWKTLLKALLNVTFEWLGFGAKTAIGYGQMMNKAVLEEQAENNRKERLAESGIRIEESNWNDAILLERNPGAGTYRIKNCQTGEIASGKNSDHPLSSGMIKKFKKKKSVKVTANVKIEGSSFTVISLEPKDS